MIAWYLIMRNIVIEMYRGENKHPDKGFALGKQVIIDFKQALQRRVLGETDCSFRYFIVTYRLNVKTNVASHR